MNKGRQALESESAENSPIQGEIDRIRSRLSRKIENRKKSVEDIELKDFLLNLIFF